MTRKHALMLSRYFPPMFDVGGKRAYRFARYLGDHHWRATVLTERLPEHGRLDSSPLELPENCRIVRELYPPSMSDNRERFSDGTVGKPISESASSPSFFRKMRRHIRLPVGHDLVHLRHVVAQAKKLHEEDPFDAIWATSAPYTMLVFGAAIKAALGIPLILDLRDPWTLNFLAPNRPPINRKIEEWTERWLFQYADRTILNCNGALDAYKEAYPEVAHKLTFITNAFDPAQRIKEAPTRTEGPCQLVHFGNCYGPRSMGDVLRAASKLVKERNLTPEDLQILNLGRVHERDLNLAEELGVKEHFSFRPFVPHAEGLQILADSDLQVLLAYGRETLFLPAKLYDYMLTPSPILCLSEKSELTGIIDDAKLGSWARPGDISGIAAIIEGALDARQGKTTPQTRDYSLTERFSAPSTTAQLAELLHQITK